MTRAEFDALPWQEKERLHKRYINSFTCPECGKRAQHTCFGFPSSGIISKGQWYCSTKHWEQNFRKRAKLILQDAKENRLAS